jgi:hypothetical protein
LAIISPLQINRSGDNAIPKKPGVEAGPAVTVESKQVDEQGKSGF